MTARLGHLEPETTLLLVHRATTTTMIHFAKTLEATLGDHFPLMFAQGTDNSSPVEAELRAHRPTTARECARAGGVRKSPAACSPGAIPIPTSR